MSNTINKILTESALKILRPLVRVLLRNGVACGSFEELVRKAYVEVAFAMGESNSKKTTISSVSAQTGLSRKEVKRLSELESTSNEEIDQKYSRGTRVISGWVNDDDYTDSNGNALNLPVDGDSCSFASLVKQYSGDIPTKAMLDLLLSAECVEVTDNTIKLVKHAYVPGQDSAEVVRILGTDANELLTTIDHNLTAADNDKRYQRKVSTATFNKSAVEEFKSLSNEKSQALLEELDAWLAQHEVKPDDDNACYVSLGIYYYEQ